jgi:hypothetical protein
MKIENLLFDIAEVLLYPVLIAALLALLLSIVEVGVLAAELYKRRDRGIERLDVAIAHARHYLAAGDNQSALNTVHALGYNEKMAGAFDSLILQRGLPDSEDRIAKRLAEYDYASLKRLERPALAALADGNVQQLTSDLRVAFSVTVTGLLIGMIAFAVSLVRDRLYAQDFSDVEYAAAALGDIASPPAMHASQAVGLAPAHA